MKKTGLGKGLNALIPETLDASNLIESGERIQHLPLTSISPDGSQPRTVFDAAALKDLTDSIREHGVIQPIVVSPEGRGYVIVAGERRWRASKDAGCKDIPAIVRTTAELERLELAIVENVQRVSLSPLEEAASIVRLHEQFNLSFTEIAKKLGKASSTITNTARLLQLNDDAKAELAAGRISEGHARQLLALKDEPERQAVLLKSIVDKGWSVRQAEEFVASARNLIVNKDKKIQKNSQAETQVTNELSKRYGVRVSIKHMTKGGKLELRYKNEEELSRLLDQLKTK